VKHEGLYQRDIEGVAGITAWDERRRSSPRMRIPRAHDQRVAGRVRRCRSKRRAEIWIKDAHGSGRNIILAKITGLCTRHPRMELPSAIHGIRNRPRLSLRRPLLAIIRGRAAMPILRAHASLKVARITLNGEPASEFLLHALAASRTRVPAVFISGDGSSARKRRVRCATSAPRP